jgi:hypothetical protein
MGKGLELKEVSSTNNVFNLGLLKWRGNPYMGTTRHFHVLFDVRILDLHTRKNAQVVTSLQTNCYKSVHKLSTSCVRTACSQLL